MGVTPKMLRAKITRAGFGGMGPQLFRKNKVRAGVLRSHKRGMGPFRGLFGVFIFGAGELRPLRDPRASFFGPSFGGQPPGGTLWLREEPKMGKSGPQTGSAPFFGPRKPPGARFGGGDLGVGARNAPIPESAPHFWGVYVLSGGQAPPTPPHGTQFFFNGRAKPSTHVSSGGLRPPETPPPGCNFCQGIRWRPRRGRNPPGHESAPTSLKKRSETGSGTLWAKLAQSVPRALSFLSGATCTGGGTPPGPPTGRTPFLRWCKTGAVGPLLQLALGGFGGGSAPPNTRASRF